MRVRLTRAYRFSASHRLQCDGLSQEQNRAVYGKCNNPHGHGHNYRIEVTVQGAVDPRTGMVMNMADLDAAVATAVTGRFHLANLNQDPLFAEAVPTTENLCRAIDGLLRGALPPGSLAGLRIEETSHNSFEYEGGEPLG
jgi:6-pyruvoyltetrahydropterin/6-carboxytetrahydropterin synthase